MIVERVLRAATLLLVAGAVIAVPAAVQAGERCDYDGDGKVDLVAVRATPPSLTWFIRQSTAGFRAFTFGTSPGAGGFDMPICGDFDGDGKSDPTVLRLVVAPAPQPVTWFIQQSTTGTLRVEQFGSPFDTAYVADWNGDGRDELVMARVAQVAGPTLSQITHYNKNLANGAFSAFVFGTGDHYILGKGDVDGDGISDPMVYDTSTVPGVRYASPSTAGLLLADPWGNPMTDYRYVGNFDFDLRTDLAVMRGYAGSCCDHWIRSEATGTAIPGHGSGFTFGTVGDLPASGDYVGDGRDDIAVYRDSTRILWIHNAGDNSVTGFYWGAFGDILLFIR
jgi:hypothetical protein